MKLYAFKGKNGDDPHEVVLTLSAEDAKALGDFQLTERDPGRWGYGKWFEVTDQETGKRWRVASAPCGQPCHCAAVAEEVASQD